MFGIISIAIVVGTSIMVFIDAKRIGVRKGQVKGLADLGPGGWLVACLGIWVIAFPAYLLKRGEFLKANDKPKGSSAFIAGGAAAIVAIVVIAVLGVLGQMQSALEDSARSVVTSIVQGQLGGSASCVKVRISDRVTENLYRATATLDNGRDLPITIEDMGEKIVVRIVP